MLGLLCLAPMVSLAATGQPPLEIGSLDPSGVGASARFGRAADLDGDTAIVGTAQGTVHLFVRSGPSWSEEDVLTGPVGFVDEFGWAVAVSGDTAVVGAPRHDAAGLTDSGAAYVYVRNGQTWSPQGELFAGAPEALAEFGHSVAVLGDTIAVGARSENSSSGDNTGAVYVFTRTGSTWSPQDHLVAGVAGAGDQFGSSVALLPDELAVGASGAGAFSEGAVFVFLRSGSSWSQQTTLAGASIGDSLGVAVDFSGDRIVAGGRGAAVVFTRTGSAWNQQDELSVSGIGYTEKFGADVAIEGEVVLVGAPEDSNASGSLAGTTLLFRDGTGGWQEESAFTPAGLTGFDRFGSAVAIDGSTMIASAPTAGTNPNGQVYGFHDGPVPPLVYCTAGVSAAGCQALLSATGTPSASASTGFSVSAGSMEGSRDGLFLFAANGRQASPWGNGTSYQCVAPPVVRGSLLAGTGTPGACDGTLAQDLNALWCPSCPKPQKNPGAGAIVQAQLWYRDPTNTSNQTTSLSDAIEFAVGP